MPESRQCVQKHLWAFFKQILACLVHLSLCLSSEQTSWNVNFYRRCVCFSAVAAKQYLLFAENEGSFNVQLKRHGRSLADRSRVSSLRQERIQDEASCARPCQATCSVLSRELSRQEVTVHFLLDSVVRNELDYRGDSGLVKVLDLWDQAIFK